MKLCFKYIKNALLKVFLIDLWSSNLFGKYYYINLLKIKVFPLKILNKKSSKEIEVLVETFKF